MTVKEVADKIHESFTNKLTFVPETHEYFKDGEKFTCVSDITHIYKPITSEQMAENCVNRWKSEMNPSYKYYGMTKEEILEQWNAKAKVSCDFGTGVHAFGEAMFYYYSGQMDILPEDLRNHFKDGKPNPTNKHEAAVVKFWEELPANMHPVLCETKVFNEIGTKYAGTFDLLFMDDDGELLIYDYKTNEDLFKCFNGSRLLKPFDMYNDMSIVYYMLQLNLYQIPLMQIGFKVKNRVIVWLKPDGSYRLYYLNDVVDTLMLELYTTIKDKLNNENHG
jgi:hypothetical protein